MTESSKTVISLPKLKILAAHSPMHDAEDVQGIVKSFTELFEEIKIPVEIVLWNPTMDIPNVSEMAVGGVLVVLTVTGGTEGPLLKAFDACTSRRHLAVISHPEHNSLAAGLELVAYMNNHTSNTAETCHINSETLRKSAKPKQLVALLRAVGLRKALEGLKLGVLGTPSEWLLTSQNIVNNAEIVKKIGENWGFDIQYQDLSVLISQYNEAMSKNKSEDTPDVEECVASLLCSESDCWECHNSGKVSADEARSAVVLMKLLRKLIADYEFDSITLRCFDLLKYNVSGCFALSDLNDSGFVAGCEGDIHATATMIIGQLFSRYLTDTERGRIPPAPVLMNPVDLNEGDGTISFAHCTVPRTIVSEYILRTHFESGKSVAIQGKMMQGVYTIARVDLVAGKIYCDIGQSQLAAETSESCCRTQIMIRVGPEAVKRFALSCLGNHHILIPGNVVEEFKAFARLFC